MSAVFTVSGIAFLLAAFSLTVAYWGELSNRRWEAQEQCRASQERPSVQAAIGRTLITETSPYTPRTAPRRIQRGEHVVCLN